VWVVTQSLGSGVIGVTMQGGLAPFTRLEIGTHGQALNNATVDGVGGPTGLTSGSSVTLSGGTTRIDLRIQRVDGSRSVLVPLSVVDG